jgi:ubiquinone/menaquinone biosynthesis C-methylase UbiE
MPNDEVSIDLDAFDRFEASAWEERVEGYAGFFGAVTDRLVEPLLDLARIGPGTRVLDVATGPGYVAAEAARRGATVCGVDIAEAMVARARAEHPGVEFRRADAQSLPFEEGAFDAVVANFGLPHFGRPELAVAEGVRVLAPGGRLALTTWDAPAQMRMFGVFLEAVAEAGAGPPDGLPPGPDVFRFSDDGEFRSLLEAQGLIDVAVRRVAFTHPVESFEDFWRALQRGTVRMASLVLGQAEGTRERIRAGLERRLATYGTDGRFELPVSVKLAAGRKRS